MAHWRERLFAAMSRNAGNVAEFFRLPNNAVVELGTRNDAELSQGAAESAALAERCDFIRVSPAKRSALYDRDDAALLIWQHPVRPIIRVTIATNDPRVFADLSDTFSTRFALKPV